MVPPPPLELVLAAVVLAGTVAVGLVAHELSHVLALRLAGVTCRLEFLPGHADSGGTELPRAGVGGSLATVTPISVPEGVSPWQIRVAAMMPLCLTAPVALALAGVVPDPFVVGSFPLELAAIAWLGCSVPSPQDFSLLWYPGRSLAAYREASAADR